MCVCVCVCVCVSSAVFFLVSAVRAAYFLPCVALSSQHPRPAIPPKTSVAILVNILVSIRWIQFAIIDILKPVILYVTRYSPDLNVFKIINFVLLFIFVCVFSSFMLFSFLPCVK